MTDSTTIRRKDVDTAFHNITQRFTRQGLAGSAGIKPLQDQFSKAFGQELTESQILHRLDLPPGETDFSNFNTQVWASRIVAAYKKPYNPETTTAEEQSLIHQHRITAPYQFRNVGKSLTAMGFNVPVLIRSQMDSDLGKLEIGKNLLTEPSAESDLLFALLTGNIPDSLGDESLKPLQLSRERISLAIELFGQVIQDLTGDPNIKTILNPNAKDFDKLRSIFKQIPLLQGWAHELPGLLVASQRYLRGEIDADTFKTRLYGNLLHNGPAAEKSFWKFITGLVGTQADELLKGGMFHDGTKAAYRISSHPAGLLHNLMDRADQGIAVIKIAHELKEKNMLNLVKLHDELFIGNPNGTILQIEALQKHIKRLKTREELIETLPEGSEAKAEKIRQNQTIISNRQQDFLVTLAGKMISRLKLYQKFVGENISCTKTEVKGLPPGQKQEDVDMIIRYRNETGVYEGQFRAKYDTSGTQRKFLGATFIHRANGAILQDPIEFTASEETAMNDLALYTSHHLINGEQVSRDDEGVRHGGLEDLLYRVLNFLGPVS